MPGPDPIEPPGGKGGSFVAGVFQDFMSIGRTRVIASGEKPEMFVGHFDGEGRATWLRSFPTVAKGRAVAFLPEKDQITILGVIDETVNVDGKVLSTGSSPEKPAKNILFFAVFNRQGRSQAGPTLLAKANILATPELDRVREGLRVRVRTTGGIEVPGKQIPGDGNNLELVLDSRGVVQSGQRLKEKGPLFPEPRPMGMKKARFDAEEAQSGWMLAMQPADACDYCRPAAEVIVDGDCNGCRGSVCATDFHCCGTEWDWQCKAGADSICKSLPGHTCNCAHETCLPGGGCTPGVAMQPFCTSTVPHRQSCVATVDAADDFCYKYHWDAWCCSRFPTGSFHACTPKPPACF